MTSHQQTNQRRPVVTQQTIIAAITFIVGQAVAFGLVPQTTSTKVISSTPIIVGAVFAVLAAAHSIGAIFITRKVTPIANPQTEVTQNDGSKVLEPLVPLSLAVLAEPNDAGIEDPEDDYSDVENLPDAPPPDDADHQAAAA